MTLFSFSYYNDVGKRKRRKKKSIVVVIAVNVAAIVVAVVVIVVDGSGDATEIWSLQYAFQPNELDKIQVKLLVIWFVLETSVFYCH